MTVRTGDSLWSIAARDLGGAPTIAAIAEHWPRWYAANRATIGPDADLIHPGMVLRAPTPVPAAEPAAADERSR